MPKVYDISGRYHSINEIPNDITHVANEIFNDTGQIINEIPNDIAHVANEKIAMILAK